MARVKNSNSLAENRKARHDYFVEETMEAGIELVGTEVKSIRGGKCNLKDCYADVRNGEIFILNMHISPYEQGNIFNVDPLRERKLLPVSYTHLITIVENGINLLKNAWKIKLILL